MKLYFDKIFKISITAMKINRSGPDIKRDVKWLAQFILLHGQYTVLLRIAIFYNNGAVRHHAMETAAIENTNGSHEK